jgi:hypothetical protein
LNDKGRGEIAGLCNPLGGFLSFLPEIKLLAVVGAVELWVTRSVIQALCVSPKGCPSGASNPAAQKKA